MNRLLIVLGCLVAIKAHAVVTLQDDAGNTVTLQKPAERIVSLAPHATEMLFAAGAGDRIVGTVEYSDYPAAALQIPRVGNHQQIDIERVIAARPDVLVVWLHGSSERQIEHLRKLGIPFFYSEPKKLSDIPEGIARMAKLAGTEKAAAAEIMRQRELLGNLTARYAQRPPVRTFYQVWGKPIYTLNGKHIMSDVLRVCGGQNIFADLNTTAPTVSTEAVLLADPEAMIVGARKEKKTSELEIWEPYKNLTAVRRGNL
ncbi:MAG: cobalamin-binding protein, partial [Oxalicibacterium faecigallinarum]|uniref:cobalamin-binding protein n=1 Tax=Oxalicibacterium faecigallinarum TaxID=573741 RepID=UPI002807AF89